MGSEIDWRRGGRVMDEMEEVKKREGGGLDETEEIKQKGKEDDD